MTAWPEAAGTCSTSGPGRGPGRGHHERWRGGGDRGREESASQVVSGKELELHKRKMTRGTKRWEPRACEYSGPPLAVNLVLALVQRWLLRRKWLMV